MAEATLLVPVARKTVAESVGEQLTTWILQGGLRPGERLIPERELCQHLAVGRTTLREALKSLAATGLVEIRAGEGVFVANNTWQFLSKVLTFGVLFRRQQVQQLMEARVVVESNLAELAARRASEEEKAHIRKLHADLAKQVDEKGRAKKRFLEADMAWHMAVGEAAQNPVLLWVASAIRTLINPFLEETKGLVVLDPSPEEHGFVVRAILAGDGPAAAQAMRHHLEASVERLLTVLPPEVLELEAGELKRKPVQGARQGRRRAPEAVAGRQERADVSRAASAF